MADRTLAKMMLNDFLCHLSFYIQGKCCLISKERLQLSTKREVIWILSYLKSSDFRVVKLQFTINCLRILVNFLMKSKRVSSTSILSVGIVM